jgi:hypothetical protein
MGLQTSFAKKITGSGAVFANSARFRMPAPKTVIWLRREHAGTGRPAELSRSEPTGALAIADSDGLANVSLRRVAGHLGTGGPDSVEQTNTMSFATIYRTLPTCALAWQLAVRP